MLMSRNETQHPKKYRRKGPNVIKWGFGRAEAIAVIWPEVQGIG
jgi:hypothetical protein